MSPAHSATGFSRVESWFVAAALTWLLLGPRIAVPGALGVRYEDLLFLVLLLLVLRSRARRALLRRPENLGIALVALSSLVASGAAIVLGRVSLPLTLLYSVRPLEYWIVYPSVALLLVDRTEPWTQRIRLILAGITILQTAFGVAQYVFGLQVGFSHQAYSRGAGLTAGPYELGAISAALMIFWVAQRAWIPALIAAVGLFVSISRISFIGAAAGLLLLASVAAVRRIRTFRAARRAGGRRGVPRHVVVSAGAVVAVLAGGAVFLSMPAGAAATQQLAAPITERFESTSVVGSWEAADVLAARIPSINTAARYNSVAFDHIFDHVDAERASDVGAEASNLVRFFRWHLILNNINSPDRVVLGLGPSFVGGSVDGSYLRFYADAGVIGVLAWLALVVGWLRRSPSWMVGVIVSLLVGAVFIDIVYSLRSMVLFWSLLGLARYGTPLAGRGPFWRPLVHRRGRDQEEFSHLTKEPA